MTNQEIFESKKDYNKWLKKLTKEELNMLIEMMDEARNDGYNEGWAGAIALIEELN